MLSSDFNNDGNVDFLMMDGVLGRGVNRILSITAAENKSDEVDPMYDITDESLREVNIQGLQTHWYYFLRHQMPS